MRLLAATAVLLLTAPAFAALPYDATFTWTAPTTRTSGALLAPGELQSYRIDCTSGTETRTWTVPAPATTLVTRSQEWRKGDWSCAIVVIDSAGEESDPRGPLPFTLQADRPRPPTAPSVQ